MLGTCRAKLKPFPPWPVDWLGGSLRSAEEFAGPDPAPNFLIEPDIIADALRSHDQSAFIPVLHQPQPGLAVGPKRQRPLDRLPERLRRSAR